MHIHENTTLADLIRAHPSTREVFDRYRLHRCGGPNGLAEPLHRFAGAHGIELSQLIEELRAAVSAPIAGTPVSPAAPVPAALADRLYRRFFVAAVLMVLTLGATWGAYLLWRIGRAGSFTALSLHEINAHGHAQVFGWVGLFIMGFTYHASPRFRRGELWQPGLANLSLYLMVGGILARVVAGYFFEAPWALPLGIAGSGAEIFAVGIFAVVIAVTLHQSPAPHAAYEAWIAAAILWFLLAAVWSGIHFFATVTADSTASLIRAIVVWQAPLREIQIGGFALSMILGVSQRLLPGIYGYRATPSARSSWLLILLNIALLGSLLLRLEVVEPGHPPAAVLRGVSGMLLLGSVLWLVLPWRLWTKPLASDRSLKFLRAAYLWLLVALLMAALTPVYHRASAMDVSHAYLGATRHAITVGFISMMILGVSAKVVPTLAGFDLRRLGGLWPTFLLVNLGCLLRVGFQVSTDHLPASFQILAVSGALELTGIAIWAFHLLKLEIIARSRRIGRGEETELARAHDPLASVP